MNSSNSGRRKITATLINPFEVPKGKEEEALAVWERIADYMRKQPGFISTRLHRSFVIPMRDQSSSTAAGRSWEASGAQSSCAVRSGGDLPGKALGTILEYHPFERGYLWARFSLINVAEWQSASDFATAANSEEFKKLTEPYMEVFPHYPGLYEVVRT